MLVLRDVCSHSDDTPTAFLERREWCRVAPKGGNPWVVISRFGRPPLAMTNFPRAQAECQPNTSTTLKNTRQYSCCVDADLIVHYGYACKSRPSLFLFDTMSGRVSRLPPCNLMVCGVLYRRCFRPTSRQNRRTRLVSGDTDLGRPSASTTDARQPCQSIYVVG